jgi:hypothetical protein
MGKLGDLVDLRPTPSIDSQPPGITLGNFLNKVSILSTNSESVESEFPTL